MAGDEVIPMVHTSRHGSLLFPKVRCWMFDAIKDITQLGELPFVVTSLFEEHLLVVCLSNLPVLTWSSNWKCLKVLTFASFQRHGDKFVLLLCGDVFRGACYRISLPPELRQRRPVSRRSTYNTHSCRAGLAVRRTTQWGPQRGSSLRRQHHGHGTPSVPGTDGGCDRSWTMLQLLFRQCMSF